MDKCASRDREIEAFFCPLPSKEMNLRALKTAFASVTPASLAGKTVTFFRALTFDPDSKSLLLITPVKITL